MQDLAQDVAAELEELATMREATLSSWRSSGAGTGPT